MDKNTQNNRVHFIAIGGAAMHNIAMALAANGYVVTGSDDEIVEPSRSRLQKAGLLPAKEGWFPDKLDKDISAVVLGMHARKDNPELIRAQELGLKVYSYPEFLFEHSRNKRRVVIGGSHGKTTITAMVMFVLKYYNVDFDYMVGSEIEGFERMVHLSDAPLIILEGDEYLASPVDPRPKFHLYQANIGLISGIAWDHINVFPSYDSYVEQFRIFASNIEQEGFLVYCSQDAEVNRLVSSSSVKARIIPYEMPECEISSGTTYLNREADIKIPLKVFGRHNLMNLEGARVICSLCGIEDEKFYDAISHFSGASRRLELMAASYVTSVYKDFAHSPSKVTASSEAVKNQFPERQIVACLELHTFSSLNEQFLDQYMGSLNCADVAIVYFNPQTLAHKKLKPITDEQIRNAFGRADLEVFTDNELLRRRILSIDAIEKVFLFMSSGTFGGLDLQELAGKICQGSMHDSKLKY